MAMYFSKDAITQRNAPPPSGIEAICVTDPDQLLISSRTETVRGSLVFTLNRHPERTTGVWFHKLVLHVPTGINRSDLTATPISINTLSGESSGTTLDVEVDLSNRDRAVFTLTPKNRTPIELKANPNRNVISFTLGMIEINTEPGRVNLDYWLWTSTNGSGTGTEYRENIAVYKTDNSFFFRNLRPEKMMIRFGDKAKIFWEASSHNKKLFLQRDIEPEVEITGTYIELDRVNFHTGIRLRAQTTVDGEEVNHYQTCVVLVDKVFYRRYRLQIGQPFGSEKNSFLYASITEGQFTLTGQRPSNPDEITQLSIGAYFFPLKDQYTYVLSGITNITNVFELWSTEVLDKSPP